MIFIFTDIGVRNQKGLETTALNNSIFQNLDLTTKRTPKFTIIKVSCLILLKKEMAVYTENDTRLVITKCAFAYWELGYLSQ